MSRFLKKEINRTGALLLEALIAVVILSVSLTLILHALLSNLHTIARSVKRLAMVSALENKMDLLVMKSLLHEPMEEDVKTNPDDPYQFSLKQRRLNAGDAAAIVRETKLTMSVKNNRHEEKISVTTYLPDFSQKK